MVDIYHYLLLIGVWSPTFHWIMGWKLKGATEGAFRTSEHQVLFSAKWGVNWVNQHEPWTIQELSDFRCSQFFTNKFSKHVGRISSTAAWGCLGPEFFDMMGPCRGGQPIPSGSRTWQWEIPMYKWCSQLLNLHWYRNSKEFPVMLRCVNIPHSKNVLNVEAGQQNGSLAS